MPQSVRLIEPPSIAPLRKPGGTKENQIYCNTYIQITPAEPEHKVYFSTDGEDPDPWHRVIDGQEHTFKYKAPFRLREGPRIVRALSVSKREKASSRITTKAFHVLTDTDKSLGEETDEDSSTLVSVSSIVSSVIDSSESELHHSAHLLPQGLPSHRLRASHRSPKRSRSLNRSRSRSRSPHVSQSAHELRSNLGRSPVGVQDSDETESSSVINTDQEELSRSRLSQSGSPGCCLHKLDDSLHSVRYQDVRDILDTNYMNELNQRKGGDLYDLSYNDRNHRGTDDVRSYFSDGRSHYNTRSLCEVDSDGGTEVNNYFRQSCDHSTDRYSRRSPNQQTGLQHEPPAFWSTQTPRVRFTSHEDDRSLSGYPNRNYAWMVEQDDHRNNQDHRYGEGNRVASRDALDYPTSSLDHQLNPQHHKSLDGQIRVRHPQHESRRHVSPASSPDLDLMNHESLAHSHPTRGIYHSHDDLLRSPLAEAGYNAGLQYGTTYLSDPEKKKKNKSKDSSSSSSSSSSDSDSSNDKDKNKKKKKKKTKDKKEKGEKHKKDVVEKTLKEKENKEKTKGTYSKKKKEKQKSDDELEIVRKEKDNHRSSDESQGFNQMPKTKKEGLSFINDSGTQINFWGSPPDEIVKKVGQMIPGSKTSRVSNNSSRLHAMPRTSPAVVHMPRQPTQTLSPESDYNSTPPVLQTQNQQEQHSIGSFFKKLFKIDDKKKMKKKDSRSTVREEGDDAGNKAVFDSLLQECLKKGKLWEDPDFGAEDASVYYKESPVDGDIEWKRPTEISDNPQMFVGGASRFDVKQGVLGNCWLLAAVASLTTNEKLLHKVVPPEQNFTDKYAGIFRFHFWQYGKWLEVVIDDRLPTCNGELVFMHSEEGNEFWSPLMEKAYAKLCGCYENLSGGLASEAMTDFTGGVTERLNFREELPDNMFQMMLKAHERKSLMGCSIDADPDEMEAEMENGLIKGHAYSITAVKLLDTDDGAIELVRVRNPWGNECEWKGAWSDKSDEWANISEDVKESMGLQFDHDGEFWMSFRDFSTHFQRLEICHLNPDSLGSDDGSTKWTCTQLPGGWKKNVNAGGCRNFPKSYYTNPQYRIKIKDADDDDEEEIGTIIVGLMQKGRRKLRADGGGNLTMGYEIFDTEGASSKKSLDRDFFKKKKPVTTSAYINMREVCTRHRLSPGDYCIVLTTFEPNEEADYLLRLYSEKPGDVSEMDESTSIVQAQNMSVAHSAPGQKREAEKQFKKYGGEDQEVDAYELQEVLNNVFTKDFDFGGFDLSLCRGMVAMTDDDITGKLSLPEFKELWQELQRCKMVFKKFDTDKSGLFNSFELREALKHCGYTVSNKTFQSIVVRFSDKNGNIRFDDFVACVVKLRTFYRIFAVHSEQETASFTLDSFIQPTILS